MLKIEQAMPENLGQGSKIFRRYNMKVDVSELCTN